MAPPERSDPRRRRPRPRPIACRGAAGRYHPATDMGRRITVYLEDDVIAALNEHTQASPLSRSELVAVALRRFLRDERRRAGHQGADAEVASRVARGELPSRPLDGRAVLAQGPWSN